MSQPEDTSATPLALPAPPEEKTRTLNVQEENTVTLDELGPLIVNSDGVRPFTSLLIRITDHTIHHHRHYQEYRTGSPSRKWKRTA
jgi:hypothetical protein